MEQIGSVDLCIQLANSLDGIFGDYKSSLQKASDNDLQAIEPIKSDAIEEFELKPSSVLEEDKKLEAGVEIEHKHQDSLEAKKKSEPHHQLRETCMSDPRKSNEPIHDEFTNIMRECSKNFIKFYDRLSTEFFSQAILQTLDPFSGLSLFILKLMLLLSEENALYRFYECFLVKNQSFTMTALVNNFTEIQDESLKSFHLFGYFGDLLNPRINDFHWRYWAETATLKIIRLGRTDITLVRKILLSQTFINKYCQVIPGLTQGIYEIALDTALLRTRIVSSFPNTYHGFTTSKSVDIY